MTLEKATFRIRRKGKKTFPLIDKDGKMFNPSRSEISAEILNDMNAFDGVEVALVWEKGQPRKIRKAGGEFASAGPAPAASTGGGARQHSGGGSGRSHQGGGRGYGGGFSRGPQRGGGNARPSGSARGDFHNPYNFIPAPPRNTAAPELGDHCPPRQDEFLPDRYSGRLRVRMTAETPLMVPEEVRDENGHKTFKLRSDEQGNPLIPASSVRGMLRSAYEAVTNSRFGVFSHEQHKDRLAFRMEAREGLTMIPARVENGYLHLLTGTSDVGNEGKPRGPMYAAWLPRYHNGQLDRNAVRYPNGNLPVHGDAVECWLESIQHYRWDRKTRRHKEDFKFWRVRAIVSSGNLGVAPAPSGSPPKRDFRSWHSPTGHSMKKFSGWVCITNANINRKHDERVFFVENSAGKPRPFPVEREHEKMWEELIRNYQTIHEDELRKRRDRNQRYDQYLGSNPGDTAWSRHVYTKDDLELNEGTLCYVRLNRNQNAVEALFPVMIARELYNLSPWDLLDPSLRPAESLDSLSPADRVFGWVKGGGGEDAAGKSATAAWGLLRVQPVTCETAPAESKVEFPEPGVPLSILSTPKPQQGRFYVAASKNGEAQGHGLDRKNAGYSSPEKGLRGRKVYPHHRNLPTGHWENPMEDRTQEGVGNPPKYQEYRRPKKDDGTDKDDQNRSILGWVKPGAVFSFDLRFLNLSEVELGAMVWLLSLPEEHFFRFGGGKPLGFGSVRLELDSHEIFGPAELRTRYGAWYSEPPDSALSPEMAKEAFEAALARAYPGGDLENIPFIKAFLRACQGFEDGLPVHYPRATENGRPGPPLPEGESFKWFVENEKGEGRVLPDLASDNGLPVMYKS